MALKHLKNIDFVVKNQKHVRINRKNIPLVRDALRKQKGYWTDYASDFLSNLTKDELIKVLFLFNTTSFSYWKNNPWIVDYQGNTSVRGSWSNLLAIKRAIDEGISILDFEFQANATNEDFEHLWRAKEKIPLLDIRANFIRKNAKLIIKKYSSDLNNLLKESDFDAINLVNILIKDFKTFKDSTIYKGKEVTFNKRAQLFAADIHHLIKPLKRIDEISGCADYKIPITLKHFGVISFSEKLDSMINNNELIESEDIISEVRACELQAMELIAGNEFKVIDVNNFLWVGWQDIPEKERNYLRFRSTGC